jgi:very-short-patch-repair endonuclease
MKPLHRPTNAAEHAYMRERAAQNLARAASNPNENWFWRKLEATGKSWTRQAQWGYRIFDFWCHEIGTAVEVDGPEHRAAYDAYRDEYNLRRSGILVLRVKNLNEADATTALAVIAQAETWADRKARLGIVGNTKQARNRLVSPQQEFLLSPE